MEVLGEQVEGVVGLKNPVVELGEQHFLPETLLERLRFPLLNHQFHRFEVLKELVEVFVITLRHVIFAGGDVKEGDTADFIGEVDGGKEVVLALFEHFVVDRYTRCNQFNDTAFHECFGQFRIFQLLTNGHTIARTH